MLDPKWDADYRDAEHKSADQMHKGNLPPAAAYPYHIHNDGQTARAVLPVHYLPAERPECIAPELEKLHSERDAYYGDAEQQSCKEIHNSGDQPAEDNPENVSDCVHDLSFLGNQPFSTLFFCWNSSRIDQKHENAATPDMVDHTIFPRNRDSAANPQPAIRNAHQQRVPK